MEERIQKIISAAGVTSRRAAELLITEGRVTMNGAVVTELGTKADASKDHIKVDGKLINPHQPPTYIMLNKPVGFITTMSDPEGRPTVQDLLKGVKVRVYPVGRLDYNTEGLLLLTNDGDFAHLITHPKHELPKVYLAKIKGVLEDNMVDQLEKGVFLVDGKTAPAKIKKVRKEEANSWVEITIHEGKKRQVRRMFDHVGRSVIRLKRIRIGTFTLGDLEPGAFRHLSSEEVRELRDLALKEDKMEIITKAPVVKAQKVASEETTGFSPRGASGVRSSASARKPMRSAPGARSKVMQETSDGRRRNQTVRPDTRSTFSKTSAPARGTRDAGQSDRPSSFSPRAARPYGAGSRPSSGRPAARPYERRPAAGAPTRNQGARPDTRGAYAKTSAPGRSMRDEGPRSRPSSFSQRAARPYETGSRPSSDRPGARTFERRPAAGSSGRSQGTRPDSRSSYAKPGTPGRSTRDQGFSSARSSSFSPRSARPYDTGSRPTPGRPAARPDAKSSYAKPGAPVRSTRDQGFSSARPSSYSPRTARPYETGARPSSGRPSARPFERRPATGAPTWKPEARREPGKGTWPANRGAGARSSGPGRGAGSESRWAKPGARPNKSTFTGKDKGPGRGTTGRRK